MSWIPFRKQPKKPATELVADSEFDTQVEKFNRTEANTRKMYKDMKRYVEQNANLVKTHQKFGCDLHEKSDDHKFLCEQAFNFGVKIFLNLTKYSSSYT